MTENICVISAIYECFLAEFLFDVHLYDISVIDFIAFKFHMGNL